LVSFCEDYRIKPHAPLFDFKSRQFF